jgi:hypothetical protein
MAEERKERLESKKRRWGGKEGRPDKVQNGQKKEKNKIAKIIYEHCKREGRKRENRKGNRMQCIQIKEKVNGRRKIKIDGNIQNQEKVVHLHERYSNINKLDKSCEKYLKIVKGKNTGIEREVEMQYRVACKHRVSESTRRYSVQWQNCGNYSTENTVNKELVTKYNIREKPFVNYRNYRNESDPTVRLNSINSSIIIVIFESIDIGTKKIKSSNRSLRNFRVKILVIFASALRELKCHCEAVITVSVMLSYTVISIDLKRHPNKTVEMLKVNKVVKSMYTPAIFSITLKTNYKMHIKIVIYVIVKCFKCRI